MIAKIWWKFCKLEYYNIYVQNSDMEKLLLKHTKDLDVKVEDAIARAQTPAPILNPEDANLREQVTSFCSYSS